MSSEFEANSTILNIGGASYAVFSDLHTHTAFSADGRGTVEGHVQAALAKGLEQIAITEHGPGHIGFGLARKNLAKVKAEVIRVRREYPDIEVLFGIEANIISQEGELDIRPDEFDYFDFVCAGWHFAGVNGWSPVGLARTVGNLTRGGSKSSAKLIRKNTEMIVKAVKGGGIKFLTHPADKARVNMRDVAMACGKSGTLLEINTSHMSITPETLKMIMPIDVDFIISSDAHSARRVGDFKAAERLINEAGLDPARIVNLRKV